MLDDAALDRAIVAEAEDRGRDYMRPRRGQKQTAGDQRDPDQPVSAAALRPPSASGTQIASSRAARVSSASPGSAGSAK